MALIDFYGRTLQLGIRSSDGNALGGRGNAGRDRAPVHFRPQGILPGAGYRRDPGRFRSAAKCFLRRDGGAAAGAGARHLARSGGGEPFVLHRHRRHNTTLNSGRIQINLKPLEERHVSASDVIRRLQPASRQVEGITLFMQPVQDLTVEDRREPHPVSVQPRRCGRRGIESLGATLCRKAAILAGTARRRQRPAGQRAAGSSGD